MQDVLYPDFVCGLQLPVHMRFLAALNGAAASGGSAFRYCDLGCGQGRTAALVASLHPEAEVHGIDLSPAHIDAGKEFAAAAGLGNLHLAAADITEVDPEAFPEFDIIAMHGLWSWVPDVVRDALLRFIKSRLKPGGLVYVSYNCLPGAAALAALREAFRKPPEAETLAHVRTITAQLARLRDAGAATFEQNRHLSGTLDRLMVADPRYIAHEFLGEEWTPFSVRAVGATFGALGLEFAGSAILAHYLQDSAMPEALEVELGSAGTLERAWLADLASNRQFRADIFRRPMADAGEDPLLPLTVRLTRPRDELRRSLRAQGIALDLTAAPVAAFLDALSDGPASIATILSRAAPALPPDQLRPITAALITVEAVVPCPAAPRIDVQATGPLRLAGFNAAVLAAQDWPEEMPLAAPLIGGMLPLTRPRALFLAALARHADIAQAATWCEEEATRRGFVLRPAGSGDGDLGLEEALRRFRDTQLPGLREVGALQGGAGTK